MDGRFDTNNEIPEIPKRINFIWVGGPIPEKYFLSISKLAAVAKQSGFEINLWVDNQRNYTKTAIKIGHEIPHLQVRHIDELLEKMQQDPFYQNDTQLGSFVTSVIRESVGLSNFAAVSDLLRYAILRDGGYYFDTDTKFKLPSNAKMVADRPLLGIQLNCDKEFRYLNNDIIAVLPNHPVINNVITSIIQRYAQLDTKWAKALAAVVPKQFRANYESMLQSAEKQNAIDNENSKLPKHEEVLANEASKGTLPKEPDDDEEYSPMPTREEVEKANLAKQKEKYHDYVAKSYRGATEMDVKRFLYSETKADKKKGIFFDKLRLTIQCSGPGILKSAFDKAISDFANKSNKSVYELKDKANAMGKSPLSLCLTGPHKKKRVEIAGVLVKSQSAQTWLKRNTNKPASFDTNSIPDDLFGSRLSESKPAAEKPRAFNRRSPALTNFLAEDSNPVPTQVTTTSTANQAEKADPESQPVEIFKPKR